MSRSIAAVINNPEVLIWARTKAGYVIEDAAKKLSIKADKLELWEKGEKTPSFKQLLKIAKLYKRPIGFFYLNKPPQDFKPLHDYRRLPEAPSLDETPKLCQEINIAYVRRNILLDVLEEIGEKPKKINFRINITDNPDQLGLKLRKWLNINIEQQQHWKTGYEALNGWRNLIETKDILVFQASGITLKEMRGFAISEKYLPLIVLNKKDSPFGRIFSLLHELTHILLGDSSISGNEIRQYMLSKDAKKIETFCNAVAASTLLPANWFNDVDEFRVLKTVPDKSDLVIKLSRKFNISRELLWRRLLTFKYISDNEYRKQRGILLKEYQENETKNHLKKIIVSPERKILSTLGNYFTTKILSSYYQNKLTMSRVSDFLGTKIKYIRKIEQNLGNFNGGN